jgi:hypothetical protein
MFCVQVGTTQNPCRCKVGTLIEAPARTVWQHVRLVGSDVIDGAPTHHCMPCIVMGYMPRHSPAHRC